MLQSVASKFKPVVSITDASFNPAQAFRCRLLLQVMEESITMAVLSSSNTIVLLRDFQFNRGEAVNVLEELFSSSEYLAGVKYKGVTVSVATSQTTFIPSPFYNSNDSRKFLELNHSLKFNDVIAANHLRAYDLYNVFAEREELINLLKAKLGNFTLVHSATPLLEGIHVEYKNLTTPALFINVRNSSFELTAISGNQLLMYNAYEYTTPEDFIYYVLFASEQLKINPELNPVYLTGNIQKEDALYRMVYQYFRHVSFADRPEQYNYHYEFEKLPSHSYFSLFNLALCE